MSKKVNTVPDEQAKWFKRGFQSKHEYIGWLQFNDLVDESVGYDDVYHDPYSGKTIHISSSRETENIEQYDEKPKTE